MLSHGSLAEQDDCVFVQVSLLAMPLYVMLPTMTEYCVEQGWTLAYARYDRWRGGFMAQLRMF